MTTLPVSLEPYEVIAGSIRVVQEGVWYADRISDPYRLSILDIRHGVYWAENGAIVSLAYGTGLHGWGAMDWEVFVLQERPGAGGGDDVCCHVSREEAEACALGYIAVGRWCSEGVTDDF